jgi:hypothetical protein
MGLGIGGDADLERRDPPQRRDQIGGERVVLAIGPDRITKID